MSEVNPFLTVQTPAMERANRLLSIRSHPGFLEIVRISQEIVELAQNAVDEYDGWDPQEIVARHAASKAAKRWHQLWLAKMQMAIDAGEAEARTLIEENAIPEKTVQEIIEQSDELRARVLQTMQAEETRVPGSY